jgi:hypothetical protein
MRSAARRFKPAVPMAGGQYSSCRAGLKPMGLPSQRGQRRVDQLVEASGVDVVPVGSLVRHERMIIRPTMSAGTATLWSLIDR